MNLQRREEIRAIAAEFRRLFLHEQAEAIDELLAHIDALEQAAAERVIADGDRGPGVLAVKWISVNDALPEDGQTVGFVTECANDKWYHGRVLGGRYMAGEFGGFSVPGLMVQASHWFAFPPLPDALRANQGGAAT